MKENRLEQLNNPKGIYGEPPTMEEAAEMFQHKEGCSRTVQLRQTEVRELVKTESGPYNIQLGPSFVRKTSSYLICDECHVQEEYFVKSI